MTLIKPTGIEKLKKMFIDLVINKTSNVTKVSKGSTLNAFAYGSAKLGQKVLKDGGLLEANIFPDNAVDTSLDGIAERRGLPTRFGAAASSVYIRLLGDVGTAYLTANSVSATGTDGLTFNLAEDVTIPSATGGATIGYVYGKFDCVIAGEASNVDAFTLDTIGNAPANHDSAINDVRAFGGRDAESDDSLRERIKRGINAYATGTLAKYEQIAIQTNGNVLRIYMKGFNTTGQVLFGVATVGGVYLSAGELTTLAAGIRVFMEYSDYLKGCECVNMDYTAIDIDIRIDYDSNFDVEDIRRRMQIAFQGSVNWLTWNDSDEVVEWEDLSVISASLSGVTRVYDQFLLLNSNARTDVDIPKGTLPYFRSMTLRDSAGTLLTESTLTDTQIESNPLLYYRNQDDYEYQQTILA